jgi:hypothetical protein
MDSKGGISMRVRQYYYDLTMIKAKVVNEFDCPRYKPYSDVDISCNYDPWRELKRCESCPEPGSGRLCFAMTQLVKERRAHEKNLV